MCPSYLEHHLLLSHKLFLGRGGHFSEMHWSAWSLFGIQCWIFVVGEFCVFFYVSLYKISVIPGRLVSDSAQLPGERCFLRCFPPTVESPAVFEDPDCWPQPSDGNCWRYCRQLRPVPQVTWWAGKGAGLDLTQLGGTKLTGQTCLALPKRCAEAFSTSSSSLRRTEDEAWVDCMAIGN